MFWIEFLFSTVNTFITAATVSDWAPECDPGTEQDEAQSSHACELKIYGVHIYWLLTSGFEGNFFS